ncbi:MAG: ABC transporter substrate-binding protein [Microbacteriaceae bacterium]
MTRKKWVAIATIAAASAALLSGCSGSGSDGASSSSDAGSDISELKFGYFPNFTHAPAIVMLKEGFLQDELGDDVTITPVTFDSGTEAIEGLFGEAVDVTYIGPNPTITGYTQSDGAALRVIAGAASGGAGLVVRDGIDSVEDLEGTTLATPSLGNTQDVALRYWLQENGYETDTDGGGDVHIQPQDNSTALTAFENGDIDGAWVPEPWLTRMVAEGDGHILVNESDLWEDGQFVVTNLISATSFLDEHEGVVEKILAAEIEAIQWMQDNPEEAQTVVNEGIAEITGSSMDESELATAWDNIEFTFDPLPDTLLESAEHAEAVGLLDDADLDGLYDLDPLNAQLTAAGLDTVDAP